MSDDPRIEAAAHVLGDMAVISDERCRIIAEDMIAAADRASWRPISEAPQDGTPVLTLHDGNQIRISEWAERSIRISEWVERSRGVNAPGYWLPAFRATHYQPLPAPPEDSDDG